MTHLKKSSHNLRLHTYIQKITTPRGYHYKIRMKIQKKDDQITTLNLPRGQTAELASRHGIL